MIFDTHAHFDDDAFDEDRDELLSQMNNAGVSNIVNVAASMLSCITSLDLAHHYEYMYAAVGVHPNETTDLTEADMDLLCRYCEDSKCVAIGEIGLDYYWNEPDSEHQKKWFIRQLKVARDMNKPVIIHSRDAAADTMDIMKENHAEEIGGVIHCFSYSAEMAKEYVKMGFFIGVGGVVTFKNARKLVACVEEIPLENIVLETDCPYLAPEPHRGKRNSSMGLPFVAEKIANIKGISLDEVIQVTYENALRLYRL